MEKLMDNLNLFDIIAMLIPGVAFMFCVRIVLFNTSFHIFNVVKEYEIVAILVFGYAFGFAFQEIGYWADKLALHKLYYKGEIKEIFLSEQVKEKIFDNEIYYLMGQAVKDDIISKSRSNDMIECNKIWDDEQQVNRYIYNYLLDYLEIYGLKDKSDKMQVLAELSRSLMIVSFICGVISVISVLFQNVSFWIIFINSIVFFALLFIFLLLKTRYEKYRIRTIIRTYFINNLRR